VEKERAWRCFCAGMLPDRRTDECVCPYVSVVLAVMEKQIPFDRLRAGSPLRRRIRSGSGRNDRVLFYTHM
jgi:hypothetical protein